MARLDRLTVRGFKSIRALEDFDLRGLNVLIGPNGAGKSNFISLFHMLAQIIAERLQSFVAEQDGPDALLFGGRKRTERIDVHLKFARNAYHFSLAPAGKNLAFDQELTLFFGDYGNSQRTLGRGHMESNLHSAVKNKKDTFAPYIRNALAQWRVYHFHDTSATAKMRHASAMRDNLRLKPDASNLAAFLRRLRERAPDNHRQIVETVRLAAPFFGDFVYREDETENIELEWLEANDPDTVLGPRQLSDGTLRFICLATLLLQPAHHQPDLILIDEPELGLHPYAVTLLTEMLRQASDLKQIIVSTQSTDLINQLSPEDIVVVDRKDGASTFTRLNENALKDWLEDYALGDLWHMNILGGRPRQ